MKNLILFLCLLLPSTGWTAIDTPVAAGGNWGTAGTWTAAATPAAGDTVTCLSTSGSVTVNVVTAALAGINTTNLAHNFVISSGEVLVVASGGQTWASTATYSGTGAVSMTGSQTLLASGTSLPWNFLFTTGTYTLGSACTISGSVTLSGAASAAINGFSMVIGTNLWLPTLNESGSTTLIMNGSGILGCSTLNINNRFASGGLVINTSGAVTFGQYLNMSGLFTNTAGTINTSANSNTFTCWGGTVFAGNGFQFYNLCGYNYNGTGSSTITFVSTKTYSITNSFKICPNVIGSAVNSIQSSVGSSSAFLNYSGPVTNQNIYETTMQDINASGGETLFDYTTAGTLTRCTNIINALLPPRGYYY